MKPTPFLNTWNFVDHWSQRVRGPELKSGQLCQVSKECHLILIQWVSTNRSTITILETLKINDQIYGRRSWKELILEYSYSVSSGEKNDICVWTRFNMQCFNPEVQIWISVQLLLPQIRSRPLSSQTQTFNSVFSETLSMHSKNGSGLDIY